MDNNNKQLFVRLYGVAIVLILSVLSLSVQAQFSAEPADFDRLLSGEFNAVAPPAVTNSNCDGTGDRNTFGCSGVLYLRFSPTINIGDSTDSGGNQLVVKLEARAGQEAIGRLQVPAVASTCLLPDGSDAGVDNPTNCGLAGGEFTTGTAVIPGTIDADNPANILYNVEARFTYSKEIFPGNPEVPLFTSVCTPVTGYGARVSPVPPRNVASSIDNGVITYSYESANQATAPGALTPDQRIQYPADDYAELMTFTCNFPSAASNQLLGMSYHLSAYGNAAFGHHIGATLADSYVTSPENSLEFFPLDGSNYITHAEITEGGTGVLIEYAQAITSPTGAVYAIATTSLDLITPTISDSDIIWLNDRTVWLTLGSSIYDAGVNVGSDALSSDRHVFVTSTFPGDTSFGNNFAQTSTYRAVLTRHASDADLDQTAPTMTVAALDYDSIGLTFSRFVCGSPETGCAALTADHFEVVHYEGDVSSTESATLLTISTVTLTGDSTNGYTVAVLDIDLDSAPEIDGDDYLLIRTARNSRFTDNFITDRTIFSETQVTRTVPSSIPTRTYSEAASGILHLQSGALVEAIPVITYSLTNDEGNSISEGGIERSTSTFIITRAPDGVNFETTVGLTITRTSGDELDGFSVAVGDVLLTRSADGIVWSDGLIFDPLEDEKMIFFSFNGNDAGTADSVYTIALSLPAGARSGPDYIFTIEEDDNTAPVINLADVTINESDVELDDGNVRDFDDLNDYMTRGITQSSLLFSISDSVVTDDPATAATYTRVVVTLIGEGESNTAWTLTNGGDTNFGAPEETTPGKDLIYTYTPVPGRTITDLTDVASLIGKIRIVLNASEFPGITDADGTRGIEVVLEVFEEQASGTDLIGSGTAQYTLQAENDPVQYIRPTSSPVNIEGSLGGPADGSGSDLVITLVLEETATTTGYTGSLGFFTDGSAAADLLTEGSGGFLTFTPATLVSDLLTNQTFPTTDITTIRASELGYDLEVVGGEFGTAARAVTVSDGDGSNNNQFTFIVEVTEAVLRFRIKVFLEGAQ